MQGICRFFISESYIIVERPKRSDSSIKILINTMHKKTLIILIAVVVVILIGVAVFVVGDHGGVAQPQAAPSSAGSYVSPSDGFSVNFSGAPEVSNTMFNSPTAGPIPLTTYKLQSGSGTSTEYSVIYVYHYPQGYQFSSGYLSGAMHLFAAAVSMKYPGASLTNPEATQFLGDPAMSGAITVPVGGNQEVAYLIMTTKGQDLYVIGTYGMSQADYDAFLSSFSFK